MATAEKDIRAGNGAGHEGMDPTFLDDVVKETVDSAALAINALERAQIDSQSASARKHPRELLRFQRDLMALACSDVEVAESCFYSLPRREKDPDTKRWITKYIQGPSVRFAELVVYAWGNVRVGARVIAIEESMLTAQGFCLDLEKNNGTSIEVKRRITYSNGGRYSDDMIVVTGNAACSIAWRNAVLDAIPFALCKKAYRAAVKMATGGEQPLESRRSNAFQWFAKVGVEPSRILESLAVDSIEAIGETHLMTLVGLKNAIQDNEMSADEAFPRATNGATDAAGDVTEKLRTAAKKKAESDQGEIV